MPSTDAQYVRTSYEQRHCILANMLRHARVFFLSASVVTWRFALSRYFLFGKFATFISTRVPVFFLEKAHRPSFAFHYVFFASFRYIYIYIFPHM